MGYEFTYPLFAMYEKQELGKAELKKSMIKVTLEEAADLNRKGYGIFWCVNMKSTAKERIASDITNVEIKYQYVDMDKGTKDEQWKKIVESPIIPSLVVETYSGFHVYWKTISHDDVPTFKEIQKRLIEFFESDKACKDVLRVLRCPSFAQWKHYHKDGVGFLIDNIFHTDLAYSASDFMSSFLPSSDEVRVTNISDRQAFMNYRDNNSTSWSMSWERLGRLDQKELLQRLSGSEYVNREEYTFLMNSNGTEQIRVNGVPTSCFIKAGEIVADKGYGNNVFNWLRWKDYNNTDKDIVGILKHVVPEIFVE